jgi:hypothetical protein
MMPNVRSGNRRRDPGPKFAYISPIAVAFRLVTSPGRYISAKTVVKFSDLLG